MSEQNSHWGNLAAQAQKGDQQAYRQLLTEIAPKILIFLKSKVGSLGSAEDLQQEALVAIHKSLHTYEPGRSFATWMYTIARYKSIDHLRERERKWKNEVEFEEKSVTSQQSESNLPDEDDEEKASLIQEALASLPDNMRRAVELTKIQGLSTQEAAEKEGISSQALRTRISRAYDHLRKRLEKDFG